METVNTTWSTEESAWLSPKITLQRDIYLMIELSAPGKIVIRQQNSIGEFPMVPIRRHRNTKNFSFRMQINPPSSIIQIFASTQPKSIRYAYI